MSEKKKQGVPSKGRIAESPKQRPIILKSDREREPKKEPAKPKEEEPEKQPTILAKPREQIPKPEKVTTSGKDENEQKPQPTMAKVQVEAREKKYTEIKLPPPMTNSVKLIDEYFEFNMNAGEHIQETNTSFLVVGVIGGQGVGKSTIMNILAKDFITESVHHDLSNFDQLNQMNNEPQNNENILNSDMYFEGSNSVKGKNDKLKFKMQNMEQIELGLHCTEGIDMYITKDRVILLDAQPSLSSSILDESITRDGRSTGPSERSILSESMQIASYLMSVCHVLIVVQDWFVDFNFIRFILSSEMMRTSNECNTNCHLLLLHNKCRMDDFKITTVRQMQEFYRKAFTCSKLELNSGMYLYPDGQSNGFNLDPVDVNLNFENCGAPINMFLMSDIYQDEDNDEIFRGHPPFAQLCRRLRWQVHGVSRHQLNNLQNMTEKCWFQYASKSWEAVLKCTFYMEYTRIMV